MPAYPSETVRAITDFLFVRSDYTLAHPADIAVVMGNNYVNTVDEVYRLWQSGLIRRHVLFTGCSASGEGEPEADRFLARWLELGGPRSAVLMEREATNTRENMLFSLRVIRAAGGFDAVGKEILFVGKAFALRRMLMSAAAVGFPQSTPWQVYGIVDRAGLDIGPDSWWKTEKARTRVYEEIARIARYSLSGDLSLQ